MEVGRMENFDSHEQIKHLMKTGIKASHAEAIVKTLLSSRNSDTASLATKDQLNLEGQKLNNKMDQLDIKIDQVEERLNNKMDQLDIKIDQVEERLNNRMDQLDIKIDQVEERLNNRIDQVEERLNNRMDGMEEKVLGVVKDAKFETIKWMVALFVTMMLGMFAIYFK